MTTELANNIYTVLAVFAGASESFRNSFVQEFTSSKPTSEWRLSSGKLGFGGKYRHERNKVDCYSEDFKDNVPDIIKLTNAKLAEVKEYTNSHNKLLTPDAIAFGVDSFVYCDSHCRSHSTGWCTVEVSDKVKLDATNPEDAREEAKAKGYTK